MIPRRRGADRDFRIFLWGLIFVIALFTVLFLLTDKAMAKRTPQTDWNKIASFYAGRPIQVVFDPEKYPGSPWGSDGWGGTYDPGRDLLNLGPFQKKMLQQFAANVRDPTVGPASVAGLAVLIHEAIHGRRPQQTTGFRSWSNENQANALGSELVPDLLQRFFGIKIGSPLSRKYARAAKQLSGYIGAYSAPTG